jgi:predicted PurR-regulated permease PerM
MNEDALQNLKTYTLLLVLIVLIVFLLYEGRMLFIPLSFSLLISFILYPVCLRLEKYVGRMGSIFASLLIILAIGALFFQLLVNSLLLLEKELAFSGTNMLEQVAGFAFYFEGLLGIKPGQLQELIRQLYADLSRDMLPFIQEMVFQSLLSAAIVLIVPIFVALILYYRELLVEFLLAIVPKNRVEAMKQSVSQLAGTYFRFAKGMVLVYLIVGVLNSLCFLAIGLPNAIYLGMLASVLTFFPYIGIMIGGLVAVIVAWTTFGASWQPVAVVAILGFVQYLEANVIFPLAVGHQLRLNPLATLIAILAGGIVWGGVGMVLFVPFLAILRILADHIEELRPLGILIGEPERKAKPFRWWGRKQP